MRRTADQRRWRRGRTMVERIHRILVRHALAGLIFVLACMVARLPLVAEAPGSGLLVAFFAIFLAAWIGGLSPALLVTGLFVLVTWPPSMPAWRALRLAMFVAGGGMIGVLVELRHAARRRAEREHRALVEALPQLVWTAKPDGAVDYVNDRWRRYTGRAIDGRGVDWRSVVHLADLPERSRLWDRSIATGQAFQSEERLRRFDGSYRWHLVRAVPLHDESGRVTGWLGTCTDVDDTKRAEKVSRLLADAAVALGGDLEVESRLTAIAGLVVPRLADWCLIDLREPDGSLRRVAVAHADPERVRQFWEAERRVAPVSAARGGTAQALRSGRSVLYPEFSEAVLDEVARDAEHRELLRSRGLASAMCVPLVARGRTIGAITLASAESGRRYGPKDLELAEVLAGRVALATDNARLYVEAAEAREQAEAASRAKDQFFAAISHEMRTPLTPALLAISAMLDDPGTPPPLREPLEATRRGIELGARLVDDLLDVARIKTGKLRIDRRRVDGHAVVRQALAACEPELRDGGLGLVLDLAARSHHVEADAGRLQQVLWNLVKNAAKFTPRGGTVTVRTRDLAACSCGDGRPSFVVEVADTGVGIEPELLPRIFDAFEQGGEGRQLRSGGLGLGLAISRSIAEAHGGCLSAASEGPGRGATFALHLPAADPAGEPAAAASGDGTTADRPLRILLVEDDATTRKSLARLLGRRGSLVTTAADLAGGLAAAEAGTFDVLVCDLGLPDGSGLDLMRALAGRGPLPAIALTGFGMEEDVRRCREAGFADHLTKPIELPDLEAAIGRLTAGAAV